MSIKKLGLALAVSALASGANAALYVSGDDVGNNGGSSLLLAAYNAATTTTLYVDLNALQTNNRIHTFDENANQTFDLSAVAAANSFSLANVRWAIVGGDSNNIGAPCGPTNLAACGQTFMATIAENETFPASNITSAAISSTLNNVNNSWFLNIRGDIDTGNGHSTTRLDGTFGQWTDGYNPAIAYFEVSGQTGTPEGETLGFATASYAAVLNAAGTRAINPQYGEFHRLAGTWTLDGGTNTLTYSAVPVPAALWMFASGLVGLAGVARRRKQA